MNFNRIVSYISQAIPLKLFICPGCEEPCPSAVCETCARAFIANHEIIAAKEEGIKGLFPIFYSFSSSHKILVYWKNRGGTLLQNLLFAPSPKLLHNLRILHFDLIIAIPQNEVRSLKRGHSSAFAVAKLFSAKLKVPIVHDFLILKKTTGPKQASLNQWERRYTENPFGTNIGVPGSSYIVLKAIPKILLVDDFITSGSTLEKAASAILKVNPKAQIYAASLGYRPKRT